MYTEQVLDGVKLALITIGYCAGPLIAFEVFMSFIQGRFASQESEQE